MDEEARYDLNELSDSAGVTPRTVRYYIQLGLLPSPGSGAGVRYGRAHLDRLRLIRLLQAQHLPLHEIAERVTALADEEVSAALAGAGDARPQVQNSASEYIRNVLAKTPSAVSEQAPFSLPLVTVPGSKSNQTTALTRRENWERITVTADVELHVRRPLSREMNRRIERLLAVARQILTDQPSGGDEK